MTRVRDRAWMCWWCEGVPVTHEGLLCDDCAKRAAVIAQADASNAESKGACNTRSGNPTEPLSVEPACYGHCGFLGWTIRDHGRVTHKQSCPHRCEPWCQTHPSGCPSGCKPLMWIEARR